MGSSATEHVSSHHASQGGTPNDNMIVGLSGLHEVEKPPERDLPIKTNILIVDDKPENLLALEKLLEAPHLRIVKATSGNEALACILEEDFALILLDVQMPGMDGFETAELIRGDSETRRIPIIFVTAISKEQRHVFRGYEAGAVDYLFKPLDPEILQSKVETFLELHRQKTELMEMNEVLQAANQKILAQQKSVIEEERLKVLLQMAGATAHELRQPLTVLLGNIELLKMHENDPEKRGQFLDIIEEAGQKVSDIVEKIQIIRRDETRPYAGSSSIININQEIRVLLAESEQVRSQSLEAILRRDKNIILSTAAGITDSMEVLKAEKVDLVLLDFSLEDGNGLGFLMNMEKEGHDVPVVVVSGQGDEVVAARMIQAGAYDYLSKNSITAEVLSSTIYNTLEKAKLQKETQLARKKIIDLSIKDELTGLCNRRYFNEMLEMEFAKAKKTGAGLSLCMMDLDHFKTVNDTYGHQTGDKVLARTGKLLKECFRTDDLAFRYGGEEFAVLLPDITGKHAINACERFRSAMEKQVFDDNGRIFSLTVSTGVAHIDGDDVQTPEKLVSLADHALYKAKHSGRNRVETVNSRNNGTRNHSAG